MIIKGLELYTNKIRELKKFYTETLELELIIENANYFSVRCGETEFTFRKSSGTNDPFYHFAFNIPENKLSEAKEWISSKLKLIKLNGEDEFDFRSWNAHSIYFYDPAGNILELIARHNLNNSSSADFSGKSILSVSEFGLPVRDVENAYNEIEGEFSIPIFSGDKTAFCAAGDNSGLFIIVNEGRKWFPDCEDAEIFPAIITILSDRNKIKEFDDLPYRIISTTNLTDNLTEHTKTKLSNKLGIKAGISILILNAPGNYFSLLGKLPSDLRIMKKIVKELDFIHYFTSEKKKLERDFPILKEHISKNGTLWISWPKGSSKAGTDINENIIRDTGLREGLVDVKVCSVDDKWSGLKFVYRLKDRK